MTPVPLLYRLVRNLPMEKFLLGKPEPFRPLYDVEEIDGTRMPVRIVAIALVAENARAVIARLGGAEDLTE